METNGAIIQRMSLDDSTKPKGNRAMLIVNPDDDCGGYVYAINCLYQSEPAYVIAGSVEEALDIVADESEYLNGVSLEESLELGDEEDGIIRLGNESAPFESQYIAIRNVCDVPSRDALLSLWIEQAEKGGEV